MGSISDVLGTIRVSELILMLAVILRVMYLLAVFDRNRAVRRCMLAVMGAMIAAPVVSLSASEWRHPAVLVLGISVIVIVGGPQALIVVCASPVEALVGRGARRCLRRRVDTHSRLLAALTVEGIPEPPTATSHAS